MNLRHELVGAFGDPIDENPTGIMMEPAFAAAGLQWRYQLLHVPREQLASAVAGVACAWLPRVQLHDPAQGRRPAASRRSCSGCGANGRGQHRAPRRRPVDRREHGLARGFCVRCARMRGWIRNGKFVVFLGAGGAARAMSVELALAGAANITIVNRSPERGASWPAAEREDAGPGAVRAVDGRRIGCQRAPISS